MAEQVSVFIENKPGRLNAITAVLRDHRIDIRAMTIADHRDYGVAKLLVNDPRVAQRVLAEQGFAAALQPVLAVAIEDRPAAGRPARAAGNPGPAPDQRVGRLRFRGRAGTAGNLVHGGRRSGGGGAPGRGGGLAGAG